MDSKITKQLENLFAQLRTKIQADFTRQLNSVYSRDDFGHFVTPQMVMEAASIAQKCALDWLSEAIGQAVAITRAEEALVMIQDGLVAHFDEMEKVAQRGKGYPLSPSTLDMLHQRFSMARMHAQQRLDNQRFNFGEPRKPGGRPRKYDWDAMFAYLVAKANSPDGLFPEDLDGDICNRDPDSASKAIKQLMNDWLEHRYGQCPDHKDVDARVSTVMAALRDYHSKRL